MTVVTLECWTRINATNDRVVTVWSLMFEGKVIITRPTEFEARAYARAMRWQIGETS